MASWCHLSIRDDEANDLREILSQSASPGSLQSRLIPRIDAMLDEAKRPRFATDRPGLILRYQTSRKEAA